MSKWKNDLASDNEVTIATDSERQTVIVHRCAMLRQTILSDASSVASLRLVSQPMR